MKRFFSKSLFLEGLRQLKVLGIISAIIGGLISFFTVYGMHISAKDTSMEYLRAGRGIYVDQLGMEIFVPVVLVAWIVVPIAVFMLFNFMNKRNSSDFYHGIVQKRETLCLSYVAAILTLAMAVIGIILAVGTLSVLIFPYVAFENGFVAEVVEMIFKALAVAIFWIGVLLVSMSLSGTVLTNLAVTSIILFFPKVLYLVVNAVVMDDIDIYPFSYGESILSGKYNLVTGIFNRIFDYSSYSENALYAILYTTGMGILLIIGGCVAFCLRKSEAATLAAPTRRLQMVFRIIPAFVITMVPCGFFYEIFLNRRSFSEEDFFTIIVFYVMAVVAYFLYEIITTRKWRNIWKSAPGLLIILLCDVALIAIMFGRREMILAEQPKNSSYVRILGSRMSDMNSSDYFLRHAAEVKITDAHAIQILEENLSQNVALIRGGEKYLSDNRSRFLVEFRDNGKSTYRLVFVNKAQVPYLNTVVANTKTMDALTDLLVQDIHNISIGDLDADNVTGRELLREYIEEVTRKPEQYAGILLGRDNDSREASFKNINLWLYYNGRSCRVTLPIFYSMDFVEKYIAEYNREAEDKANLFLENLPEDTTVDIYIFEPSYANDGTVRNYSRTCYATIEYAEYAADTQKKMAYDKCIWYLQSLEGGKVLSENGYVFIRSSRYGDRGGRYYPLTPYGWDLIKELSMLY